MKQERAKGGTMIKVRKILIAGILSTVILVLGACSEKSESTRTRAVE